MNSLFRNKFFLVCLCIAIICAVIPSTFSLMGYHSLARDVIGVVTLPFRWCVTAVGNAIDGFRLYFGSVSSLRGENDALRDENEELKQENDRARILEEENARLRSYLEMKSRNPSFRFQDGMIISRESGNYSTVLTLNCGSVHGVAVNMPVVTEDGVVGCVSEVGLTWCKVVTLLETANSVGAYLPATGATGIVSGDYSMRYSGLCKLSYVESDAQISVGDTVLSSGTGSVYPADLVIGTVEEVSIDEFSRTVVASIRPAVDFAELTWVMVITGYRSSPSY